MKQYNTRQTYKKFYKLMDAGEPFTITKNFKAIFIVVPADAVQHDIDETLKDVEKLGELPKNPGGLDAIARGTYPPLKHEHDFDKSGQCTQLGCGAMLPSLGGVARKSFGDAGFGIMDENYAITPMQTFNVKGNYVAPPVGLDSIVDDEGKPNKNFWQQVKKVLNTKLF